MNVMFKDYSTTFQFNDNSFTLHRHGIFVKFDDGTTEEIGILETLSPNASSCINLNFRVFILGKQTNLFDDLFHECSIEEAKKKVVKDIDRLYEYFGQVLVNERKVIVEVHYKNGYAEYANDDECGYRFSRIPSLMSYKSFNIERLLKSVESHSHGMECNFVKVTSPCSGLPDEKYLSENYM